MAPINLLSVGALVEQGMSCLFSPGGITKLFFPRDHLTLPGFMFHAKVSNCLSFLKLDFMHHTRAASPIPSVPQAQVVVSSIALLISMDFSYPTVRPDLMLWHRCFGHAGMDTTKAVLTKDYMTGIHFEGPLTCEHCVACIIGKSQQ